MAQVRITEIYISGNYMYGCAGREEYDKKVAPFLDAELKVLPWREEMLEEDGSIRLLEDSRMICSDKTLLRLLHNRVDFTVQSSQWVDV